MASNPDFHPAACPSGLLAGDPRPTRRRAKHPSRVPESTGQPGSGKRRGATVNATSRCLTIVDNFRLAASHDGYLTTDFFPYYPTDSPRLEQELAALGYVAQQHGTARDLQSLGVYWKTRENYERAIPYLQEAATN